MSYQTIPAYSVDTQSNLSLSVPDTENGASCFVESTGETWTLDKSSSVAASSVCAVTRSGVGRWFKMQRSSLMVMVSSPDDLPAPVAGVIQLADNVTYFFTGNIDLAGDRLVCGQNTTLIGGSSENCRLKSTGLVGTALISSAYSLPMRNFAIEADIALNLDASGSPAGQALDWYGVNFVDCNTVGTIKGFTNFVMTDSAFLNSAGMTFDGTIGTIAFTQCLFDVRPGSTGIIIPATLTIARRFRIIYSSIVCLAGETGISFSNLASVPAESYILDTVNFSGGGTYTTGLAFNDNKVKWQNCVGVENSVATINMVINNNAIPTVVLSTVDTYVVQGVSFIGPNFQRFSHDAANNAVEYVSTIPRRCKVQCQFALTANNNNIIGFYIAVVRAGNPINPNVDVVPESETYVTASGTRPDSSFVQAIVDLNFGDKVYVALENKTSATNVTVSFLNLIAEQSVSLCPTRRNQVTRRTPRPTSPRRYPTRRTAPSRLPSPSRPPGSSARRARPPSAPTPSPPRAVWDGG